MMLDLLGVSACRQRRIRGAPGIAAGNGWFPGSRRQSCCWPQPVTTERPLPESLHLRCTNPASGASWPITVDLDHSRVDSLAATITDEWINWHDPKQGIF